MSTMSHLNESYPSFATTTLGKKPFILVIVAKWCDFCKDMKPAWDNAVTANKNDTDIVEVEHAVFQHLTEKHPDNMFSQLVQKARGFPFIATVPAFNPNSEINMVESDQQRTKEGFDTLMKRIKKTPTKTVTKSKATSATASKSEASSKPRAKASPKPKATPKPKAKAKKV